MIDFDIEVRAIPCSPWDTARTYSLTAKANAERTHCGEFMTREDAALRAQEIIRVFAGMSDKRSILPAIRPQWRQHDEERTE